MDNSGQNNGNRRQFLSNTIKLALLGSIISPLEQSCNNKKAKEPGLPDGKKKSTPTHSKRNRKKWSHESLVVNTRSNKMHLPSSKIYHYYDEIKPKHLKEVATAAWMGQLSTIAMNKQQSGNITEVMTLNELKGGINDTSLIIAIDTWSVAFSHGYEKANEKNFRLHELMLQLVALNNAIPADAKWQTFSAKIVKPSSLRKRQKWMEAETNFNERIKYISERQQEYRDRLQKRAAKYSFT